MRVSSFLLVWMTRLAVTCPSSPRQCFYLWSQLTVTVQHLIRQLCFKQQDFNGGFCSQVALDTVIPSSTHRRGQKLCQAAWCAQEHSLGWSQIQYWMLGLVLLQPLKNIKANESHEKESTVWGPCSLLSLAREGSSPSKMILNGIRVRHGWTRR